MTGLQLLKHIPRPFDHMSDNACHGAASASLHPGTYEYDAIECQARLSTDSFKYTSVVVVAFAVLVCVVLWCGEMRRRRCRAVIRRNQRRRYVLSRGDSSDSDGQA